MNQLPPVLLSMLDADLDPAISALPGNENENWLLKSGDKALVVKKLRSHSATNTEVEGRYRQHLADAGLPVIPYTPFGKGAYVQTIDGKSFVSMPYAKGEMAIPSTKLAAEVAFLLAKTHMLDATDLPERSSWYRKGYIFDSLNLIDNKYVEAKEAFAAQLREYPDFWSGAVPKGIIHGDLQADNILVDAEGRVVSLLDWEEAAIEPLLLDVAHTAQQLSFQKGVCNQGVFNAFIQGYQKCRTLTALEKEWFNEALRYTMLVLSVWVHIKISRNEVSSELFQRVGNYYRADYRIPEIT